MNDREKKLALAFGLTLLFFIGRPFYNSWFVEPIDTRKTQIQSLATAVDNLEFQEVQLLAAQANIHNATRIALPANELLSQRIYQEWITELANMYGFRIDSIKPDLRSSRGKVFTTVQVSLDALATHEQLSRFLRMFENADVLHRISSLHLNCDEHRGNPLIEISLTAEAICMPNTSARSSIFPRFKLKKAVPKDSTTLVPDSKEGFPVSEPFLVRLGSELIEVTPAKTGPWKLVRGVDDTKIVDHAPGDELELIRLRADRPLISDQQLDEIVSENFFVKPSPPIEYDPKFDPVDHKIAIRGEELKFRLTESGFPPETPTRSFAMDGEIPPGLQLDSSTGEVVWIPDDVPPATDYKLVFELLVEGEDEPRFSQNVILTLREPNTPPELDEIPAQTVIAGTNYELRLQAEDEETEPDRLKYSIEGELPDGARFDANSGVLSWTPPQTILPQELEFTVRVTDDGLPSKSDAKPIKLSVIEDLTRDTFLTGILVEDGKPQAMLYNRAENITTVLLEGLPFEAAGVRGTVNEIKPDRITWSSGESVWSLNLGENLHSRSQIARAVVPEPSRASEPSAP